MTGFPRGPLASSCSWLPATLTILCGRLSMAFLLARTVFSRLASAPRVVLRQDRLCFFAGDVGDYIFPVAGLKALTHFVVLEFDASNPQEFGFFSLCFGVCFGGVDVFKHFQGDGLHCVFEVHTGGVDQVVVGGVKFGIDLIGGVGDVKMPEQFSCG